MKHARAVGSVLLVRAQGLRLGLFPGRDLAFRLIGGRYVDRPFSLPFARPFLPSPGSSHQCDGFERKRFDVLQNEV